MVTVRDVLLKRYKGRSRVVDNQPTLLLGVPQTSNLRVYTEVSNIKTQESDTGRVSGFSSPSLTSDLE